MGGQLLLPIDIQIMKKMMMIFNTDLNADFEGNHNQNVDDVDDGI